MKRHPKTGFTLIELSLVLVIIGLLIGGVLAGQDLIAAAQARSTVGQYTQFQTAVNVFKDRYGCIPTKCPDPVGKDLAETGGPGDTTVATGDGQERFDYINGAGAAMDCWCDALDFWYQLSRARMLPNNYTGYVGQNGSVNGELIAGREYPMAKLPSLGWWINGNFQGSGVDRLTTYFSLVAASLPTANGDTFQSGVRPAQAFSIDSKLDDGLPLSGNVVVFDPQGTDHLRDFSEGISSGNPGSASCVVDSVTPNAYNVSADGLYCGLMLRAGF